MLNNKETMVYDKEAMVYIHNEYYTAVRKIIILQFVATLVELEGIALCEIRKKENIC